MLRRRATSHRESPHVLDAGRHAVKSDGPAGPGAGGPLLSFREAVFTADGHKCRACAATEYLEVDHIKPLRRGGEHNLENAQTLCRECHERKTRYEGRIRTEWPRALRGPLPLETAAPLYFVATGVWNATKNRWELDGPFASYEEAWERVEGEWLGRTKTP